MIEDLKKERERFVAFAFAAAEIFFEIDTDGNILFESGAVERFGSKPLKGTSLFDYIDPDDKDVLIALLLHLKYKGRIGPLPMRFHLDNGRVQPLRLFALRMPDKEERIFLALRAAPLGNSAGSDDVSPDTGLLTQESFMELAAKTMQHNPPNNNLYLTALEVNGLDDAQKKFGSQYMLTLLNKVSAHLKTLSVDGELAGQISDKHFAFMHRTKADGVQIGKAIQKVDPNVTLKTTYTTLASDAAQITDDQILRTLSYALAKFCENPKDLSFDRLSSAYETMAREAQYQVMNIRSMIETGNFKISFQPVVSLSDSDIHHHEVLSRFDAGTDERTPAEIIRFAEQVGIIEEFDLALCHKAIDYIRKMKKLGTPLKLGLNISGRTLESNEHAQALTAALKRNRDIAHSVILELTETSAITELEKVETILSGIKDLGYKISLDDFGSGAAGYHYLRAFNVDYVKIDGSYIKDLNQTGKKPTFLTSIVRLCQDLNIQTIAEHVENKEQAKTLKSLGVNFGQGYYFGKPDFSPKMQ